jgi:hypothetical protein
MPLSLSEAAQWRAKLLESDEPIALPLVTLWAFPRIATHSGIWSNPVQPAVHQGGSAQFLVTPCFDRNRRSPLRAMAL